MLPFDWFRYVFSATVLLLGCDLHMRHAIVLATESAPPEPASDRPATADANQPAANSASDLAPAALPNLPATQPQPLPAKDKTDSDNADAADSPDQIPAPATLDPALEQQLQQALDVAKTLDDPLGKATLLSGIARQYTEIGQSDTADDILAQALKVTNKIKNETLKRTMRATIARQYLELGQPSQAQAIVAQLDNAYDRVGLMVVLAEYYIETVQPDQAAAILSDSITLANTIADKSPQAQRLAEISLAYNRINQPQPANRLIAQSQDLLNQVNQGFPFQPQPLQGNFGFSLSANIFDTSTALLKFNAEFHKQWPVSDVVVIGDILFDFDNSRTINQLRPGGLVLANYRRYSNRKWQYFANLVVQLNNGFLSSSTEDEDTTSSGLVVVGKGVNLWRGKSPERFLDLQVGVGVDYLADELRSANLSVSQVNPILFVSLWSRSIPIGKAKIDQTLSFATTVNDFNDFDILSRTKLSIPLTESLSFNNTLQFLYRNQKILDTNPNVNLSIFTGLGYSF